MSLIDVNHVVYPAVDVSRIQDEPYTHIIGPAYANNYIAPQTSAANNNSSEFSIRFSDLKTALDPSSLVLHLPVTITKVGTLGINPYQANAEGFCSNPIEKIGQTLKIKADGQVLNYSLRDIIYGTECLDEVTLDAGEVGDLKMIDNFQNYSDVWGTNSSPYAIPHDNVVMSNRRSYPIQVAYDGVNTSVITATLVFALSKYDPFCTKQLYPLCSDEIVITFEYNSGQLHRMYRVDLVNHAQGAIVPTITLGQANLRYRLNQLPAGITSPVHERYTYTRYIGRTPNTSPVIGAGAQFTIQSGVNELGQVPKLMIVFLKRAESTINTPLLQMTNADHFASIEGASVQFGNRTNVFATMSQKEMQMMSRMRGLSSTFSYPQWVGTFGAEVAGTNATGKGSVLVFSPILDIGGTGNDFLTNGVNMKNQFSVNITARNLQNAGCAFDLNVVEVYDSMMIVNNNLASVYDVISSSTDVVASSTRVEYPVDTLVGGSVSSFFRGLWDKGKQIFNVLNPILRSTRILSKGAKMIPKFGEPISSALDMFGYGDVEGGYLKSQTAGVRAGRKKKL